MLRKISALLCALLMAAPIWAKSFSEMYPDLVDQLTPEDLELVKTLDFQQGDIIIGNGLATLKVGPEFYYLNPSNSGHVLEKIWGNPPSDPVLGMIFPADISPLHSGGWGMTIWFEELGYVSDEDANSNDYNQILTDLQADTVAESKWRQEQGYGSIELIGWAEPPLYEQARRILYWAKELKFDGNPDHTLNFNIRILGRKGVLVQNFITGMDQIDRVKGDLPAVLDMTSFNDGNRYADFDPSIDKVAAVGIGGLVAGKVLAKTGLLAVALIFLKKAWFLLFIPLIWLKNLFTNRRKKPTELDG